MRRDWTKKKYQIRASFFWAGIILFILLIFGAFFRNELYMKWMKSGGREDVIFEGLESGLKNKEECYLCGSSDYSLIDYYRQFNTIGIISLNDWYVLNFQVRRTDIDGNENTENDYRNVISGNTGEIFYTSDSNFDGKMASIKVSLPEKYRLKTDIMENHLCQECLDKITESLEYSKWKYESKEAIPLCIVDFKDLEIYSLQDWHRGCRIRDYWVEINPEGNEIYLDAYCLTDKEDTL